MKKILIIFILFILVGCNVTNNEQPIEQINKQNEYIKSINDMSFYDCLADEPKKILDEANIDNEEIENYSLEMWGKDLIDYPIKDIYNNDFNFIDLKNKKVIIELAQNNCAHCKAQMKNFEDLALANSDIVFVQYFMSGDFDEICEFYERSGCDFIDNIIVIPENKELRKLFEDKYNPQYTPTFMFFNNNVLTYDKIGELSYDIFNAIYDIAYNGKLKKEDLITKDGISIFDTTRDFDMVLNDYSITNINKLNNIPEAQEFTINNVGKQIDYNDLYDKDGDPLYYKNSYADYINKPLVVFYLGDIHNNLKDDLDLVKEFKNNHNDLNVLVILMDNKDLSTSNAYKQLNYESNFDVISSKSIIPDTLLDLETNMYPCTVFIENNLITGGFYNMKNIDDIENAYSIFIGEECISLIKNN